MTTFAEYESFDGLGLASLVKRNIISADELLDAAIERVEERNPRLNAVIHTFYDEARASIKRNVTGVFAGVPFLLKDLFADYAHQPSTSGCAYTRHYIPQQDGELVKRFKACGLIMFGKTNVPEFGLSPTTESKLLGAAHNPWDLSRTPGGSSGGSAVAVASGMVPMAHGNDGGGSLRIPASYCGLFGFKPSRGQTVGGSPTMRAWEAMVVEHVMTRSVRDSAAMLDVLSDSEPGFFLESLDAPFTSYKIAVLEKPFFPGEVSAQSVLSLHKSVTLCQSLGHSVEPVSIKLNSSDIAIAYLIVLAQEMNVTLARIATLSGRRVTRKQLELETYLLFQLGDFIKAPDITWATEVLTHAAHTMTLFFKDYDMLMSPTMPTVAPKLGTSGLSSVQQGAIKMLSYLPSHSLLRKAMEFGAQRSFTAIPYTPIFNISGQPAMSVPLDWDMAGLPIGTQFAAGIGAEKSLFQLARQLEVASPWFDKTAPNSF